MFTVVMVMCSIVHFAAVFSSDAPRFLPGCGTMHPVSYCHDSICKMNLIKNEVYEALVAIATASLIKH